MKNSILSGSKIVLLAACMAGAASLSGVVSTGGGAGGGGTPVADAQVVLTGFGGGGGGGGQALDTAVTNAQGQYSFAGVTTGFKQVTASKTGFNNGQGFANIAQDTGKYTANITMTASGGGGGETGVVSGTVRAGTAQGAPIANALVVLSSGFGGGGGAFLDSARTNAQGQYRFDSVPAVNNYTARVTATGYNPATNNNVDVNAGDTTIANFNLTAVPGPGRPGSISGTVRKSADNEPLANATVVLSRTGLGGGRLDSVKTGADGHFAFDSVAANTNYVVTVTAAGFQTATNADVDVVANQTTTVDFRLIGSGPNTNRGSIIGTVTDNNKKAIVKARVVLSRSGQGGGSGPIDTVETDASGDFAFDSVTALQNYTVTVTAVGYQTAVNNNVDVVAGQAVPADFILVPSTGILAAADLQSGFRLSGSRGVLTVEFAPSPWAGRLSAYDLRGALAYSGAVPAGARSLSLPSKGGMRFLMLERGGTAERLSVAPAR